MAQKTLIDGTEYQITKGRTLVNGTGYDIFQGRTLVDGTGYDIILEKIIARYVLLTMQNNYAIELYKADGQGSFGEFIEADSLVSQFGDFSVHLYDYVGSTRWDDYATKEPVYTGDCYVDYPEAQQGRPVFRPKSTATFDVDTMKRKNRILFIVPPDGFEIHEHINNDYHLTM